MARIRALYRQEVVVVMADDPDDLVIADVTDSGLAQAPGSEDRVFRCEGPASELAADGLYFVKVKSWQDKAMLQMGRSDIKMCASLCDATGKALVTPEGKVAVSPHPHTHTTGPGARDVIGAVQRSMRQCALDFITTTLNVATALSTLGVGEKTQEHPMTDVPAAPAQAAFVQPPEYATELQMAPAVRGLLRSDHGAMPDKVADALMAVGGAGDITVPENQIEALYDWACLGDCPDDALRVAYGAASLWSRCSFGIMGKRPRPTSRSAPTASAPNCAGRWATRARR